MTLMRFPKELTGYLMILLLVSCASQIQPKPPIVEEWRAVDPENLLLIETKYGQVAVELAPAFAPLHYARMRTAVRSHFFDKLSFYRVIDGFVAQGGSGDDDSFPDAKRAALVKPYPALKAEFDFVGSSQLKFVPLGNPDFYAPEVGHLDGFPVGHDPQDGRYWQIHCPGTFAFARDSKPDTATTEFYIVIGQAPRRLDRNLTAFGRVISGMEYLQKLSRGNPELNSGVIADEKKRDSIIRMSIAADLPVKNRPSFEVIKTESVFFAASKEKKRRPGTDFLVRPPPPILDICLVPVAVRAKSL
jgi:peptidylprolyl isomerase